MDSSVELGSELMLPAKANPNPPTPFLLPFCSRLLPICSPERLLGDAAITQMPGNRGTTSRFPGLLVSRANLLPEREPVTPPNRKSPTNRAYSEASPGSYENVKTIGAIGGAWPWCSGFSGS